MTNYREILRLSSLGLLKQSIAASDGGILVARLAPWNLSRALRFDSPLKHGYKKRAAMRLFFQNIHLQGESNPRCRDENPMS